MKKKSARKASKKYFGQVLALIAYYLIVLIFSFWLLFDTWSSNLTLMRWVGVRGEVLEDPLLRTIGFTLVGGVIGNVLYLIRQLYYHYAKKRDYDPRWLGKYITGPWEGAGMALVVLALIRGGIAVFGGSMEAEGDPVSNFCAFGTAALVGFGLRDVVRWIDDLVKTMFTVKKPEEPEEEAKGSTQGGEAKT